MVLVAAMARGRVIGRAGALPWHLPEDLRHFRELTQGQPLLMGRKTWDSLPPRFRPLPGRRNLVLTRQPAWHADGAERVGSVEEALAAVAGAPRLFVIGGAEVYAAALPRADALELTEIDADFEGDTRFPDFDGLGFEAMGPQRHRSAAPNAFDFEFVSYRRAAPSVPA
jgi:dihydrofolate reductase